MKLPTAPQFFHIVAKSIHFNKLGHNRFKILQLPSTSSGNVAYATTQANKTEGQGRVRYKGKFTGHSSINIQIITAFRHNN